MQLRPSKPSVQSLLWLASSLVIAAFLCARPISDSDTGWHLALGRLIAHGDFPSTNTLAWTQTNHGFYPTSWLFDWLCYVLTLPFGMAGVQVLIFFFTAVALAGVAFLCHREGHARWLVVPLVFLLENRMVPRPHLASWAVLALCVALCLTVEGRSSWRRAWCLPLIAFGSNFHAGAVFSSTALGIFCVAEVLRERTPRVLLREGVIAIGGVLALMVNPGGSYNFFYAIRHLSMYGTLQLTEFEAPSLSNAPGFFVMGPLCVALAIWLARKRLGPAAATVVFAGGGIFAVRIAFNFYLAASPIFAAGIGRLKENFGTRAEQFAALLVFGAAVLFAVPTFAQWRPGARFDEQWIPVRAVEFAKRAGLDGKVWNGFNDGGYLEWALPEVPAYQDARVLAYDAEFFHAQQHSESSPEAFDRYLRDHGVEWVLTTNLPADLSGNGLVRGPEWALVYWDDLSEIYVRRDVPRFAEAIARYEYKTLSPWISAEQLVTTARTADVTTVEALEREVKRFESTSPHHPVGRLARCAVATRLGRPDASRACTEASADFQTEEMRSLVKQARGIASNN